MKYLIIILWISVITGCIDINKKSEISKKRNLPSHVYSVVNIDDIKMKYYEVDYLPVYSDIYYLDGTRRYPMTITVSIRNTSLRDSAYILSTTYHDSYGKLLYSYVDSTILLRPLESIEYVVEEKEDIGGAGANFIVEWATPIYSDQILIQALMVNTYSGLSFLTDIKKIKVERKDYN